MHLPPTKSTRLLSRLEMLWLQLVTSCLIEYTTIPMRFGHLPSGKKSGVGNLLRCIPDADEPASWEGAKWRKLVPSQVSSVPPCAVLYTKPYKTWRRPWTGGVGKILSKLAPLLGGGFQTKKMVHPTSGKAIQSSNLSN